MNNADNGPIGRFLAEVPKHKRASVLLIAVNVIVFFLAEIFTGSTEETEVLIRWGGAYVPAIREGQYYRFVTAMFLHSGMSHLVNNMLLLFVMGEHLDRLLGTAKFVVLYLVSGILANIAAYFYYLSRKEYIVAVGASGAIFAVIGAILFIVLRCRGKADGLTTRQLLIMLAFSLYFGAVEADVSNIAHVSGLVIGFVLSAVLYRKPGR